MEMEILEGRALMRRIMESYSRDPKGWSFMVSPSPGSAFFDATVSGPDAAWMLKIDTLFKPSPIIIGSAAEALTSKPQEPFPYGYRELPPGLALQIMETEGGGPSLSARRQLLSVLKSEPVVPESGGSYAEGPLVLAAPSRLNLSESQREVDAKLASEMRRLLRIRYPAYG